MTNREIEMGEIVRQNGIVNVLKQLGFEQDKDFIFIKNGPDEHVFMDGDRPLYAIRINSGAERPMQLQSDGKMIEIPVLSEMDMNTKGGAVDKDGKFKYGITSGNNSVGAVYIPFQGMIISPNYNIKNIMQEEFGFKDTGFGVPLSNSEQFRDKNMQEKWRFIINQDKIRRNMEKKEGKNQDVSGKCESAILKLQKTVKTDKMPLWAQQQLQGSQKA